MALSSVISSLHRTERRILGICILDKELKKELVIKVEKLIEKYGTKYPDGKYPTMLVIPNVCKETMLRKTGIIPRRNGEMRDPWEYMYDRKNDPYLIVNPHMERYENVRLGELFSNFYKNPKSFLRPEEVVTGIFSGVMRLNNSEVFTPIVSSNECPKNGMLIWKKDATDYHTMVDGFSKGIPFANLSIPRCEEIIA